MKAKDLKNKTESELQKILKEKREKLRELRFTLATGKLKNPSEIKEIKKDIARILTFLNIKKRLEKDNKNKKQK
jgi:large subunit ribosomal protein L29